jgi:hypothetical protein
MATIRKFKKHSFYLLSSILALVVSYIIVENSHSTETTSSNVAIPYAHADIAGDAFSGGDDNGDGN